MTPMAMPKSLLKAALLGWLMSSAQAHTWVEQLMVVAPNGTMVGQPGFARGNVLRSSSGFSDPTMVNIIPANGRPINEIFDSDLMCKSSQTTPTQTGGSPRLQAAPGSNVALRYQENGHVTLPANQPGKPPNRGTVFVYGTTQPSADDSFLSIHRVWNADGTGGDGRGVLLSTQNFDDGQCYQVNGGAISTQRQSTFKHAATSLMGADLWCQQDIQLPVDAPTGQPYTLYWVWDWPTLPGTAGFPDGKQEIYTTCMDVDVVASDSSDVQAKAAGNSFVPGQDFGGAGISSELADVANPTAVTGSTIGFSTASGTATAAVSTGVPAFLTVHSTSTIPIATSAASVTAVQASATGASASGLQGSVSAQQASPTQTQQTQSETSSGSHGKSSASSSVQPIPATSQPTTIATEPVTTAVSNTAVVAQSSAPLAPSSSALQSQADTTLATRTRGAGGNFGTAITATNPGGPGMATVTHFDSVFQTVYQTVYNTDFNKREAAIATGAPKMESAVSHAAAKACSKTAALYRLKARSPFIILPAGEGERPGC